MNEAETRAELIDPKLKDVSRSFIRRYYYLLKKMIPMKKVSLNKIVGFILLTPALLSVLFFLFDLFTDARDSIFRNLGYEWFCGENGTSALPFYFGLMAIAGVYLIKDKQ